MRVAAVVCDRCGEEADGDEIPPDWLSLYVSRRTAYQNDLNEHLELCAACRKSFVAWVKPTSAQPPRR
jgi:hypothetical protein